MNSPPRDITTLSGDDLFAALISDTPVLVDNRKARKKAKKASPPKANGKASQAIVSDPILDEATRIQRIVAGFPDREWQPVAVILMVSRTTCLTCGSHHEAPYCEVPMLKLKRNRPDKSNGTKYIRLDHRVPAIHAKLLRKIQHQQRFTYSCQQCFEETSELSSPDERSAI